MAQQIRKRRQKTIRYEANNKTTEQLSRGMIYRELGLRLRGQLTVSDANNTAAKTLRGDEFAVVRRVDLIANNTEVIRSIRGPDLWWLNYRYFGVVPEVSAAIANSSVANPAFDSTLRLPLWQPRSIRPMDTCLDGRELSDLKIEVTWGSHLDINGDATGFTVAPVLEVSSLESFGVRGPFSQYRVFPIELEVAATNPGLQVQLPVGKMYRGFTIVTLGDGVERGDILNNLRWVSGTTVFADQTAKELHEEPITRYGLPREPERRGDANNVAGVYFYDHVTDGYLSEAVDSLGFSELTLELDVTKQGSVCKVLVYPHQLIPVRGAQRAA